MIEEHEYQRESFGIDWFQIEGAHEMYLSLFRLIELVGEPNGLCRVERDEEIKPLRTAFLGWVYKNTVPAFWTTFFIFYVGTFLDWSFEVRGVILAIMLCLGAIALIGTGLTIRRLNREIDESKMLEDVIENG